MFGVGSLDDFPLHYRLFLRAYRWRRIDPVPWTPLRKPLSACRMGLVSSAGFVLPTQQGFDSAPPGGDYSFREIPADTEVSTLVDCHRSDAFDHAAMRQDPNLAFPIDRVRELAERGRIGSVAPRHVSFMGSISAPGRLIRDTAPGAARLLVEDQVDLVLLVPV
jgi:D-proline reductase (dithiol) PrdB